MQQQQRRRRRQEEFIPPPPDGVPEDSSSEESDSSSYESESESEDQWCIKQPIVQVQKTPIVKPLVVHSNNQEDEEEEEEPDKGSPSVEEPKENEVDQQPLVEVVVEEPVVGVAVKRNIKWHWRSKLGKRWELYQVRRQIPKPDPTEMPPFGLYHAFQLGPWLTKYVINLRKNSVEAVSDLSRQNITPTQCALLAVLGFAFNTSVEVLDISSRRTIRMADKGFTILLQQLVFNWSLAALNVSWNDISDQSMPFLVHLIQINDTLTSLDVQHNRITAEGILTLCKGLVTEPHPELISLNLSWNAITDQGAALIGHMLRKNTTLTDLNLSSCGISNTGALDLLSALSENHSLYRLDIHGKDMDPEHLMSNIDAIGAQALGRRLLSTNESFSWLCIGKAWLPVDKLKNARSIEVSGGDFDENDALVIAECLADNTTIEQLNISCNPIGRWGIVTLLEAIVSHETLRSLDICETGLYNDAIEAIGDVLVTTDTALESFIFDEYDFNVSEMMGNALDGPVEFNFLETELSTMEKWFIGKLFSANPTIATVNGLTITPEQRIWDLSGKPREFYEVVFIAKRVGRVKTLDKLCLNSTEISPEGAQVLATEIRNSTTLKELDVEHNDIGPAGGEAIGESLQHNISLVYVNLSWNELGDYGVIQLGLALKQNKTLQYLDLRGNKIQARGMASLSEGLALNASVISLNCRWNLICPSSAHSLAAALLKNRTLTHLNIDQQSIQSQGAVAISEALDRNRVLKILHCSGDSGLYSHTKGFETLGGEAFSKVIKFNTALIELHLGDNRFSVAGAMLIAHALSSNKTLQVLDLSSNNIDPDAAVVLFRNITHHPCLTQLDLHGNSIQTAGTRACVKALLGNTVLRVLNLDANDINEEGMGEIGASMDRFSTALIYCGLKDNRVSDRTKMRLQQKAKPPLVFDL